MDPLSAAVGAGISTAGDLLGGYLSRSASRKEASKQRKFIRWQMRNRIQLQMADMRDAGLNPILAYKQVAPSGGTPGQAVIPDLSRIGSRAVATAKEYSMLDAQKNALRQTAANQEMQAYRNAVEVDRAHIAFKKDAADLVRHEALGRIWQKHGDNLAYWEAAGAPGINTAKELGKGLMKLPGGIIRKLR